MATKRKELVIKFAKINPNGGAIIPTKRDEDAGYDIYPHFTSDYMRIDPHQTVMIPSGIASVIPTGYFFKVEERGSTGTIGIKTSSGVIDSGYRGEWNIVIYNSNQVPVYIVKNGFYEDAMDNATNTFWKRLKYLFHRKPIFYPYEKAIAQVVLHEIPTAKQEEITYQELLSIPSERGLGKLGSSNK